MTFKIFKKRKKNCFIYECYDCSNRFNVFTSFQCFSSLLFFYMWNIFYNFCVHKLDINNQSTMSRFWREKKWHDKKSHIYQYRLKKKRYVLICANVRTDISKWNLIKYCCGILIKCWCQVSSYFIYCFVKRKISLVFISFFR